MTIATLKIVFWALAFVFFVVCEVATGTALVSIWLAIAALNAMFCAIAKLSFLTQCIVFVVSSIILLLLTRPVVKKLQNKTVATNYELDVGKTAIVIEPIDNSVNKGRVTLEGTDWAARTEDGSKISEGTPVKVVRIDGAKLIVSEEK